jgi:hypothetical protein
MNVGGGYVEKLMFLFYVRISHVLRFISICDLFTDTHSYYICFEVYLLAYKYVVEK